MSNSDIDAKLVELRLERSKFEQDKLDFKKERAEKEGKFFNKNFGTIIAAVISAAAVIVSSMQVWIAKNEVPLKQQELTTKEQEQKTKVAEFVMSNSKIATSGSVDERFLLRQIMDKSFPEEVCKPVRDLMLAKAKSVDEAAPWLSATTEVVNSGVPQHPKVFLQYNDTKDAATIDLIMAALSKSGYEVQGKELVSQKTNGEVRYFDGDDRTAATKIASIVDTALKGKTINRDIQPTPLIGRYKNIPRGVFEVWLPSL